jgi:hypothetical protein
LLVSSLFFFYVPHHSCSSCQTLRVSIEFCANKANPIHFTKLSQCNSLTTTVSSLVSK